MDAESVYVPNVVPVFPLPDVVLFPRTVIPLRIFEPRYRSMTADALQASGMLALALLQPGFEPLYYTKRAPVHPIVCIGRIVAHEQDAAGDYTLLVQGLLRARIEEEFRNQAYRRARVDFLVDADETDDAECDTARTALQQEVQRYRPAHESQGERWSELLGSELPLGAVADIMAASLPIDSELKQLLLAETHPARRATAVIASLQTVQAVEAVRRSTLRDRGLSQN